ncbi:MAG: hypothetical protein AB8H03_26480 [Saprospiraceae bacterium]
MNLNSTTYLSFLLITLMLMSFDGTKDSFLFDGSSFDEKQIEVYNIENLNSKGLDFCAVPYRNGIVFTSSRNKIDGSGLKNVFNNNYFDLYYSEKIGDDIYKDPQKLRGKINGDLHDGTATFNQVGDMMYFTRNNERTKGLISLKIYSAEGIEGHWINLKELPFNSKKFSTCHPSLSKDGKILYFASDRPGGYGGMDIYKSIFRNGEWGPAENLGVNVNGEGNELFPYINKGGHLFFSSDGYGSLGRLDIFLSKKDGKGFKRRKNVGEPFNSEADDFGFYIDKTGEHGYLSSNRQGGKGNDDVYGWKLAEKKISKKIIVVDESTGEKINEAEVFIDNEKQTWTPSLLKTVASGVYEYDVQNEDAYFLKIEKEGYEEYSAVLEKEIIYNEKETIVMLSKRKLSLFSGKVQEQVFHKAMENVEIELLNECDGRKQTTKSNQDGTFGFTVMCGCEYIVISKKKGFMTKTKIISKDSNPCHSSQLIEQVIEMRPVPNSNFPRASIFDDY